MMLQDIGSVAIPVLATTLVVIATWLSINHAAACAFTRKLSVYDSEGAKIAFEYHSSKLLFPTFVLDMMSLTATKRMLECSRIWNAARALEEIPDETLQFDSNSRSKPDFVLTDEEAVQIISTLNKRVLIECLGSKQRHSFSFLSETPSISNLRAYRYYSIRDRLTNFRFFVVRGEDRDNDVYRVFVQEPTVSSPRSLGRVLIDSRRITGDLPPDYCEILLRALCAQIATARAVTHQQSNTPRTRR